MASETANDPLLQTGRIATDGTPPVGSEAEDWQHRDWMRQVCAGERRAFEQLYLAFHPRLARFCSRLAGQPELAEDAINETMLVVWEKAGSFDFSCKVSTWIFGIAYRKTLKILARSSGAAEAVPLETVEDIPADGRVSPARQAEAEDFLAAALAALSPEQRAVVDLTFCQGLHYQEIAAILGCPENTVKTRMFHARKKLRALFAELAPEGAAPP
ncbi:RNA polymerase sigma factor [Candidatus Methylocalor cossyra]